MSDLSDLLALLPDVVFVDADTGTIEENIITVYEGLTNTVLYPGDPVRLFLSTLAAVISQLNSDINYTGKMNLLRYATGDFLDHIGAIVGAYRTDATYASTTLQFTLQDILTFDFIIPQGTRVTSDGTVYFATDSDLTFYAGASIETVTATALTAGTAGNGQAVGQLTRLVDPLAYVVEVTNLTESNGGNAQEGDEAYRQRIAIAPESFSVAGPVLAYVYWAKTAHSSVTDVSVFSPEPGTVQVCPLLSGGIIPEADGAEINAIRSVLTDEKRRPLCDTVIVTPPDAYLLDYTLTWFITDTQKGYFSTIEASVQAAVAEYETWQTSVVGRAVNPDALIQLCRAAGAWRVEINGLVYTRMSRSQVVQFAENTGRIIYGGEESGL